MFDAIPLEARPLMRGLLIFLLLVAWLGEVAPVLAQATDSEPAALFAREPKRPKAESPIRFSKSWDEARAEANRTGHRLMAYFTSEHCGWCRVLEKRTFTDAEVVELSKQFVCVEVNIGEDRSLRLADAYRIDTIPRSYILTPDGQVIDRRIGYLPAAEYAAWLKGVGTKPPAEAPAGVGLRPAVPRPAGDPEAEADVVIWYVDANRGIERWIDGDWTSHNHLLRLLHAAGFHPRVEHIAREDFPVRWDRAEVSRKLPVLITADNWAGLVRELDRKGRLIHVQSERLVWMAEVASCADFQGRWLFLVAGSPYETAGRRAVDELLRSGPETHLPGPELNEASSRNEAAQVARSAVVAYRSGDPEGLKAVASSSSPQLTRCTVPHEFRSGLVVDTREVEVRGNDAISFATVEMRFRGKTMIGADPVAVVLRREGSHWKAFSVGDDVQFVKALPELCRLRLRPKADSQPPLMPRLLHPDDGGPIGQGGQSFAWEVPAGSEPLAAQVCEVLLNEKGTNWPSSRIKIYPGEPRARSLPVYEPALTGAMSDEMIWCVWAIGADGRLSASEARRYRPAGYRP
jgi:thioredoxin-related protein